MRRGQAGDFVRAEPVGKQRLVQRGAAAVVVAPGAGTDGRVAVPLGERADLVLRPQEDRAHVRAQAAHPLQRVENRPRAGGARGQVKHRLGLFLAQRLERRKQRGDRLADAGRGLAEQALPVAQGDVDVRGHLPLPGAEAVVGEGQRAQGGQPRLAMSVQRARPAGQRLKAGLQQAFQLVRGIVPLEPGGLHRARLAVDQVHPRAVCLLLMAEYGRVQLRLRPVGGVFAAGQRRDLPQGGLDLLDHRLVPSPPQAVHPAVERELNPQALDCAADRHLGAVVVRVEALQGAVGAGALLHAHVQVALARQVAALAVKLRHCPHVDSLRHAPASLRCFDCTGVFDAGRPASFRRREKPQAQPR